ncbi:MAG: hypothetical protein ABFD49_04275 [Armatimonadota bacterium]|nr:hypothetical protein [bacterium]
MPRLFALIAVPVIMLSGCGGGGSTSDRNHSTSTSSVSDVTVSRGDKIAWTNDESNKVKIVSGTLEQVSSPTTSDMISCYPDGTLNPKNLTADFGDTIQWRNDADDTNISIDDEDVQTVELEILDSSDEVIATLSIKPGKTATYNDFPRAGKYTYRVSGKDEEGTITLYGIPTPDGNFESMYLNCGQKYSAYIFQSGVQSYYVIKEGSTKSYMTAQITVE